MKKCPYCAEEVQDEAVICKWCGRSFSRAAKIINSLRKFILIAILCLGLVSIFLPIVHLELPIFGKSSYSVFTIVKQSLSQNEGQGLSVRGIYTLKDDFKKNIPDKYLDKLDDEKVKLYTAIIKGSAIILVIAYLAYFLVIILGILGLRKIAASFSLISCLCSLYILLALRIVNKLLQQMLSNVQIEMKDNPFAAMFSAMFKEVKITPGGALYVLLAVMGLVFLISVIWRPREA